MYFFSCFSVFLFYVCIKQLKQTNMKTLETLKTLATILIGFSLTYFYGYVIMALLFYFELTDWSRISENTEVVIKMALGVPFLLLQIRLTQYAINIKQELNN